VKTGKQAGKKTTDLWAGIAATAFFLLTAPLFGIGWLPVCVLLSALVYVGVRLLFPGSADAKMASVPTVAPETLIAEIRSMESRLPPALAARLKQISSMADRLLAYFRAYPERSDPGLFLTQQHLQMAHTLTQRWLETARAAPQQAPQSAQKLNEFLTDVSDRLSQLYQGLTQADDAHLAGEIEALTRTMKEMDVVYQRIGGDNS
jgi:hypothetical protein